LCVDASFVVDLVSPHAAAIRSQISTRWHLWQHDDARVVAPPMFFAEVTSVLRNHVYRQILTAAEGEQALQALLALEVETVSPPDLQQRAWNLARQYNLPRAYDAQYLAVARLLGCDLWTTDQRLANAVGAPWVRLVQ
jgi:predicted nucleic acid-binding protein